jgi:hypothetical protein
VRKLPTSVQLFGQIITVVHVDNFVSLGGAFGDWDHKTNTIRVQALGFDTPNDVCFQAYNHELFHAMCDLSGHTEWSANEQTTELFGQMMYQAEQSRKYS